MFLERISFLPLFLSSFHIGTAFAAPRKTTPRQYPLDGGSINWGPCAEDILSIRAVECANFTVPLDYTDLNSNKTLNLELLKVPALVRNNETESSAGDQKSILFNFGGPGLESRHTLAAVSEILLANTGGQHDLITWDPRGTAQTLTFSCYANATARAQGLAAFSTGLGNSSDVALGQIWAATQVFGEACSNYPEARERGQLISSAFTSRDMIQIVDALGEDGMLRYWGLSYGTALGATVSAMFPERVDKVVIDGVLNPHEYYYYYDIEAFSEVDKVLTEFIAQCLAAPNRCLLATSFGGNGTRSAAEIEAAIYDLIYEIKYHPIVYQGAVLEYSIVKLLVRFALYSPSQWTVVASFFDGLLTNNLDVAAEAVVALAGNGLLTELSENEAPYGIHCADKESRAGSLEELMTPIQQGFAASRLLGDVGTTLMATCAQWKIEPKERYEGRFVDVKTANPLLIIGNSFDSATPLRSAVNISASFEGSVVLEHGGHGHATLAQPSVCTAKAIAKYFNEGVLPELNTVCEPAFPVFAPSQPWDPLYPELGFPELASSQKRGKTARIDSYEQLLRSRGAMIPGVVF